MAVSLERESSNGAGVTVFPEFWRADSVVSSAERSRNGYGIARTDYSRQLRALVLQLDASLVQR